MNNGGSAFPHEDGRLSANGDWIWHENTGMTLRDYFAAKAMQGDVAASGTQRPTNLAGVAGFAYAMADAMLAARATTPGQPVPELIPGTREALARLTIRPATPPAAAPSPAEGDSNV
jgi:hypothetical protein